ncbi:MAG: hypothetical protein NTX09_04520 [Verrucomicrobia bacterium]|nr:hypothetical protein [Verrucomicrobiota bacterium]
MSAHVETPSNPRESWKSTKPPVFATGCRSRWTIVNSSSRNVTSSTDTSPARTTSTSPTAVGASAPGAATCTTGTIGCPCCGESPTNPSSTCAPLPPRPATISLANGAYGYLPTAAQHRLGGYETWLGTNVLEIDAATNITDLLLRMAGEMKLK